MRMFLMCVAMVALILAFDSVAEAGRRNNVNVNVSNGPRQNVNVNVNNGRRVGLRGKCRRNNAANVNVQFN